MLQTIRKNAKKLLIYIMIIIIFILAIICINKLMIKILYKKDYSEQVKKYSQIYNVEENLIYAIIKAESNFDKNIESNKDAKGLMQILYSTAQEVASSINIEITEQDLFNEEVNINIGTKYISNLIQKYNNKELAIAAYNAGSGNVDKWIEQGILNRDGSNIEQIPFKETNIYVRKVIRNYRIYNNID